MHAIRTERLRIGGLKITFAYNLGVPISGDCDTLRVCLPGPGEYWGDSKIFQRLEGGPYATKERQNCDRALLGAERVNTCLSWSTHVRCSTWRLGRLAEWKCRSALARRSVAWDLDWLYSYRVAAA